VGENQGKLGVSSTQEQEKVTYIKGPGATPGEGDRTKVISDYT